MTRMNDDAADKRLERLLDEELRMVVQAPPVELRAKVLRALDEGRGARDAGRGILQPRWAFAFAAAVVVLAILVTWRGSVRPAPEQVARHRAPLASTPIAAGAVVEPASAPAARRAPAAVRRASPVPALDTEAITADATVASNEPYLPGAPAGELGDPIRPMPSPPPITFSPITSAPLVSEFARPVTDFPADNPAPAAATGNAGPSGGTRR